jgi:hypothetical protein
MLLHVQNMKVNENQSKVQKPKFDKIRMIIETKVSRYILTHTIENKRK